MDSPQYGIATSKHCHFAVIFPWINDLPETDDSAAALAHVNRLVEMVDAIHANSPGTNVVIMDYYRVVVTELGNRVYGNTISPRVVGTMNQTILNACSTTGLLGSRENVYCMHIEPHLLPLDNVLVRSMTASEFSAQRIRPYEAESQAWFDEFWTKNPNSSIAVDGVHLNSEGKRRLSQALHIFLQSIDPSAFVTVLPF
jgi:lysophospholipase L1-like esterase